MLTFKAVEELKQLSLLCIIVAASNALKIANGTCLKVIDLAQV